MKVTPLFLAFLVLLAESAFPRNTAQAAEDNSAAVAAGLEKCAKADFQTINKITAEIHKLVGVEELPTVLKAARDKRVGVRLGAVCLFWRYQKLYANKGVAVVPVLVERLSDENPDVRWIAANSAVVFPDQGKLLVPALLKLLDDKAVLKGSGRDVANNAVVALGCLGAASRSALPALIKKIQSGDVELRRQCFYALGRIGRRDPGSHPKILEVIKAGLQDKKILDNRAAAAAAASLMGPGAKPAVPELCWALRAGDITDAEQSKNTRLDIMGALREIGAGAATAVPDLLVVLDDRKQPAELRARAAEALAPLGVAAKRAIPALSAIAKSRTENHQLQMAAEAALKKLQHAVTRVENPCPPGSTD